MKRGKAYPFEKRENPLEILALHVHGAEREIRNIVLTLMNIIVYKRRRELLETYTAVPERVRRLILEYVREIELGNLTGAENVVKRSISEIFDKVYDDIKKIIEKYQLVERCY